MKKIVAIGGGDNGRIKDGVKKPYETSNQDKEIIRLTGKERPNFLLIAHSQQLDNQDYYFEVMSNIYGKIYNCPCRDLKSDKLTDEKYVKELIDWADIIYEGGGNTLDMIKLWKETGFDKVLEEAWNNGKVMCGVSAGANCWFKSCSSDSLKILHGDEAPLINVECLGLIDGLFVPHADEPGREDNAKEILKETNQVGLLLSNCAALEIIDDGYRLITSDAKNHNIKAYGKKAYWKDNKYIEEYIDDSLEFKPLNELLKKEE